MNTIVNPYLELKGYLNYGNAMKLIKQLERILKVYYPDKSELFMHIRHILLEFEAKGYCKYSLTGDESIILLKDNRKPPFKLRKFPDSPFPYLSNLEYFGIVAASWNEELLKYGIKTRSKSDDYPHCAGGTRIHLIQNWSLNYRCNQYLRNQYKRLRYYREHHSYLRYWNLSYILMQQSWSFKISCLNNWLPRWYKDLSLKTMRTLWKGLEDILLLKELRTEIQNLWIESPKGKWRQLGIPNKSWRLYLHMLNMFLSYQFEPILSKSHYDGFIYNRGCKSWWTNLLWSNLLTSYNFILEVDIASGFPNMNQEFVRQALLNSGRIPEKFVNLILFPLTSPLKAAPFFPTLETFVEDLRNQSWRQSTRSVHMGLGISPILFVITQHWVFSQLKLLSADFRYCSYADDWTFFFNFKWLWNFPSLSRQSLSDIFHLILQGENPILHYFNNLKIMREVGLKLCPQKSGWVRLFGLWLKPLNSLGLSLYTKLSYSEQLYQLLTDELIPLNLRGNTRGRGANPQKGTPSTEPSRLELENLSPKGFTPLSLNLLINQYKSYFGLFLSKLYGGKKADYNPYTWKQSIERNSALGMALKSGFNKSLSPQSRWTLYNSGSKINKLLLGIIRGDKECRWIDEWAPRLKQSLSPSWSLTLPDIKDLEIPNPLPPYEKSSFPENDAFQKYSELIITDEELKEYKRKYDLNKKNVGY